MGTKVLDCVKFETSIVIFWDLKPKFFYMKMEFFSHLVHNLELVDEKISQFVTLDELSSI